jgi:hypothetical protein
MKNPRHSHFQVLVLICSVATVTVSFRTLNADGPVPAPKTEAALIPYLGQPVPGLTPERFAPGIVCTKAVELNGVFSPDGREFYFARLIDGIDTMHQIAFANGKWGAPRELLLFPNRVRAESADMAFSPDGQELYFLADFPRAAAGQKPNYDIWRSRRVNGDWATAELVPPPISTKADELYPIVGNDGSLYFNSDRPGRLGESDIFRAARRPDGSFDTPVNIGGPINSEHGSGDMCLAPDESYLIMTPKLPGGRGRGDLHVSFRQPDGSWGELRNLGDRVNTAAHEWCPMVTPDGKYLFFSRWFGTKWGDGGDGEVYWVDIRVLDQFRPKAANGNTK